MKFEVGSSLAVRPGDGTARVADVLSRSSVQDDLGDLSGEERDPAGVRRPGAGDPDEGPQVRLDAEVEPGHPVLRRADVPEAVPPADLDRDPLAGGRQSQVLVADLPVDALDEVPRVVGVPAADHPGDTGGVSGDTLP